MAKNDFVSLNGMPFEFEEIKPLKFRIGSERLERTLLGNGWQDITTTKKGWSLKFVFSEKDLSRLETVFDLSSSFSFINEWGVSTTVSWISRWNPIPTKNDYYDITVELEEI